MRKISWFLVTIGLVLGCGDSKKSSPETKAAVPSKPAEPALSPYASHEVTGTIDKRDFKLAMAIAQTHWDDADVLLIDLWAELPDNLELNPCGSVPMDRASRRVMMTVPAKLGEQVTDPSFANKDVQVNFTFSEPKQLPNNHITNTAKITLTEIGELEIKGKVVALDERNGHSVNGNFVAKRCDVKKETTAQSDGGTATSK